ncbi:HDOD domain-containing protein [candidate division GN15 bacterium]|nr:HDOD domain-containing protein [candidate division GN15 bacterium]
MSDKFSIIEEIRSNSKLLSLPQTLSEILDEVGKDNFSPDRLASIILKDPSLTGRILKLANSPFYARFNKITTVNQAVSLLGVTTVKCMALSTSVFHPDKIASEAGVDPKSFFTYVLSIASASEKVATAVEYRAPEEAMVAGLLNEIGILFFLHHHPDRYRLIMEKQVPAKSLDEAEQKMFGIDHAEVGKYVAEAWGLPPYMLDAIGAHHGRPIREEGASLGNIVRLAVLLTNDKFSGFEPCLETRLSLINEASLTLSLDKDEVDQISSQLLSSTIDMAEYLGLDIGNIEQMLVSANEEIWKSYLIIENLFKERQELSRNLLEEERAKGAIESKNVAMATLSHYMNNAAMAIYGRSQLLRMMLDKGQTERLMERLDGNLKVIDQSVRRIVAVMEEMKEISPIDEVAFHNMSEAMNIDDRIAFRLENMSDDFEEIPVE